MEKERRHLEDGNSSGFDLNESGKFLHVKLINYEKFDHNVRTSKHKHYHYFTYTRP